MKTTTTHQLHNAISYINVSAVKVRNLSWQLQVISKNSMVYDKRLWCSDHILSAHCVCDYFFPLLIHHSFLRISLLLQQFQWFSHMTNRGEEITILHNMSIGALIRDNDPFVTFYSSVLPWSLPLWLTTSLYVTVFGQMCYFVFWAKMVSVR